MIKIPLNGSVLAKLSTLPASNAPAQKLVESIIIAPGKLILSRKVITEYAELFELLQALKNSGVF